MSSETPNLTPEQKEANKNYILSNLDKYTIDAKGGFFHTEKEIGDNYWYISSGAANDYEEVKEKVISNLIKNKSSWDKCSNEDFVEEVTEKILLEKADWEIVYVTFDGKRFAEKYRNPKTGEEVNDISIFNTDQNYILRGELGFRERKWKDYDEKGKHAVEDWWRKRKQKKANKNKKENVSTPLPNEQEPENPTDKYQEQPSSSENNPSQKLNQERGNNDEKVNQLKTEIEQLKKDSSESPDNEEKIREKEEELVKVKVKNDEDNQSPADNYEKWTYEQLIAEIKKLKSEIKQLKANQDIDSSEKQSKLQVKLEKIEKIKAKINTSQKLNSDNKFPTGWVVGGGVFLLVIVLSTILIAKKQKKRK